MINSWTISINGGVASGAALFNVEALKINLRNMAADSVEITEIPTTSDSVTMPFFSYGDAITIYEDSTVRFHGTITSSPRVVNPGKSQRYVHTAENVIWRINKHVYEQEWYNSKTTTIKKTRVKLGVDGSNERVSIGDAIKDVLDQVITAGVPVAYNAADLTALSVQAPTSTALDITAWEAIRQLLRWSPDILVGMEYGAATSTIRFIKRAAASASAVDITNLNQFSITPRSDLRLDGVLLRFEKVNSTVEGTWTDIDTQSAGNTSGTNVLKQTIDLYGIEADASVQTAKVVTTPVTSAADVLETYLPGIANVTDYVVSAPSLPAEVASYPNILLEGSVPEWSDKSAVPATFSGTLAGKVNEIAFSGHPISVEVVLTDADSKTYSRLSSASFAAGESVPTGLADEIYTARSQLHFEGSAAFVPTSTPAAISTLNVLNLTVPPTAWTGTIAWLTSIDGFTGLDAIRAVIQQVSIEVKSSHVSTAFSFGPPSHLEPQDLIALLRVGRHRIASSWSRKNPIEDSGVATKNSGATPGANASAFAVALPAPGNVGDSLQLDTGNTLVWKPSPIPKPSVDYSLLVGDATAGEWIEGATESNGRANYLEEHPTRGFDGTVVWKTPYIPPDELPTPTLAGQILRSTITEIGNAEVKGNEWITLSDGNMLYGTTQGAAVLAKGALGSILAMGADRPAWVGGTLSNNDILQFNGTTWVPISLSDKIFELEIYYGGRIHKVLATS